MKKGRHPGGCLPFAVLQNVRSIFARRFAVDWKQKKTSHRCRPPNGGALQSSPGREAKPLTFAIRLRRSCWELPW